MDKHTRPYKCIYPSCAKLQGFTYSGGLIRHEREVHNAYGGPKRPLMCPHQDCKRSTGNGFSRRENLREHLRRVHRGSGDGDDVAEGFEIKPGRIDRSADAERCDAVASSPANSGLGMSTTAKADSAKRKRMDSVAITDDGYGDDADGANEGDLRNEVKRLKAKVAHQAEMMRSQGEALKRLETQMETLLASRQH